MKKIIIYNLLLITLLTACSEREKITIGETTVPVLSSGLSTTDIIIEEATLEETFCTFTWNKASFGVQSANPEYTLWLNISGNHISEAIPLATTKELELSFTNDKINQQLLAMGATPDVPFAVEFSLTSNLNGQLNTGSNTIAMSITPLKVVIVYPGLYLAGTFNGWTFSEDVAIYSVNSNDVYEGYIFMDNGADWSSFKLSYQPNWDNADAIIGDPDAGGTSGTIQVGNWGGNNIFATEGIGYYKLVVNVNTLTYSIFKTDWGITGDFNSWANAAMAYDLASDTWSITADFTAGGFKFIANYDWGFVYGDDEMDGILNPGTDGNNIQIAEDGNYTVTLDLSAAWYTYSIEKN